MHWFLTTIAGFYCNSADEYVTRFGYARDSGRKSEANRRAKGKHEQQSGLCLDQGYGDGGDIQHRAAVLTECLTENTSFVLSTVLEMVGLSKRCCGNLAKQTIYE